MGLDLAEIVIEVEQHFGVAIAEEEAAEVRTVGDLVRLLETRVKRRDTPGCLALPWFLKLRAATRSAAGDQQLRVRPSQLIEGVLRPRQRRTLWRSLARLMGAAPRNLQRPVEVNVAIVAAVVFAAGGACFYWPERPHVGLLALAGVGGLAGALHVLTLPLRVVPPIGWRTFGDVTRRLVGNEAVMDGFPRNPTEMILDEVRDIVVHQLGVDPDEVTMQARFVEDLGMD